MVILGIILKNTIIIPVFTITNDKICLHLQQNQRKNYMEQLSQIYCRYNMVCEAPSGGGVEIVEMPAFFTEKKGIEADYAHIHNFYEIVWFKKGGGKHYVDFTEYPIEDNTIFFLSPGQVHNFDDSHCQTGYVMKICGDLLSEATGEDMTFLKYNIFGADSLPYHQIDEEDALKLDNIIKNMSEEIGESGCIGHKDYLRSLVKMLIIRIERGCRTQENRVLSLSKTSHKTFLMFRQELEKNYRTLHSVKDYAQLLGISTKTLTNYVNECSPLKPLEIINSRVIIEAKRMLRYSNLLIKEIGYKLGFEDPSYFVKFFKRETGMLPIDFRENYIINRNITVKEI